MPLQRQEEGSAFPLETGFAGGRSTVKRMEASPTRSAVMVPPWPWQIARAAESPIPKDPVPVREASVR